MSVGSGRAGGAPRIVALIVLGLAILALQLRLRGEADPTVQLIGQLTVGALFLPALVICWRGLGLRWRGLAIVLVFAVAFRAAAFVPADQTPPLSTDIHRYAWDGRTQLAGINPYRDAPSAEVTRPRRDDVVWPGINRKTWETVYPPGAQASFAAGQWTFGDTLRSTTWLFLIFEVAAIGLLVLTLRRMRAPPDRVLAYAWHPLAVSEIAGNGHVDALAVFGICALLAAWSYGRRALAGLAVSFAALVKLGPVLLVPALARRGGPRFLAAAIGLAALAYLPYAWSVGTGVVGSIRRFDELERFNGSLDLLLRPLVGRDESQLILLAALVIVVVLVAFRCHDTVEQVARSSLLVLGTLLVAVDYVQPWQALWLTPLLAIVVAPGWTWLTLALPLAYVAATRGFLPWWGSVIIWAPVGLWAIWRVSFRRVRSIAPAPLPVAPRVAVVIPVLNEAVALQALADEWAPDPGVVRIVVDGGSSDATVSIARSMGATLVVEGRRGYGRACAAGAAIADADIIVFMDGDGSCDPRDIERVVGPVLAREASLSLGRRDHREPGSMSRLQRLGNTVVAAGLRIAYGVRVGDVPCLRAIRADSLKHLGMCEMTYGWPTEMIVRAARQRLAIAVVPVSFRRRRGGRSKVSGRLRPAITAGAHMLRVVLRDA